MVTKKMRVCVIGTGHLAQVTISCLAELGIYVSAFECFDTIDENGLKQLLQKNNEKICFTNHYPDISKVDFIWFCEDTPVQGEDDADIESVKNKIDKVVSCISKEIPIIISSQLPVGTIKELEEKHKLHTFCSAPENLRHGTAIKNFLEPDRIIIGIRKSEDKKKYLKLFSKISDKLEWMTTESAEMTKHAINSFLAMTITFANEIGDICKSKGIDYNEVLRGLLTEERIGSKARLRAGNAYTGKTLARDIKYLISMSQGQLFKAIKKSNDRRLKSEK